MDRGRKIGLISGQLFTICGAGFQAGSHGSSQYMAARFILGFGIAFTTCSGPAMLSELAHPRIRGIISSLVFNSAHSTMHRTIKTNYRNTVQPILVRGIYHCCLDLLWHQSYASNR